MLLALLPLARPAGALDILGVQPAALDQPRVNALLRRPGPPVSGPLTGTDVLGDQTFNISAFLDTGASGVVLSEQTADLLGVQRSAGALFEDIGIAGTAQFHVSEPLRVDVAPSTPFADINNPATAATVYAQRFGPLRSQIGPLSLSNPLLEGTDILGMPAMQGKVVVMDPKPLDTLLDVMRTYVYDPGTAFRPGTAESDPGIPATNRTIALSYTSFDRFTRLTPASAEGPAQRPNPFVGPDPVAKLDPNAPVDHTPGVTLTLGDKHTTGSFLLDTGAAASVISRAQALNLNVRYRAGTTSLEVFDPASPAELGTLLENQFVLTLSGVGGDQTASGFFLDSLLVRTQQGNPADDDDPAHLRYMGAPVLVADISLKDPLTGEVLTLDGLFAMNLLVASIFVSEDPLTFGEINPSAFRWIVFDQPDGILALDVAAVPEPQTWVLVLVGTVLLAWRHKRSSSTCQRSDSRNATGRSRTMRYVVAGQRTL